LAKETEFGVEARRLAAVATEFSAVVGRLLLASATAGGFAAATGRSFAAAEGGSFEAAEDLTDDC